MTNYNDGCCNAEYDARECPERQTQAALPHTFSQLPDNAPFE